MAKIETNSTLTVHFIGDAELKPTIKVIERKGNFAKIEIDGTVVKRKVFENNGEEYILPYGKYSMCPHASI